MSILRSRVVVAGEPCVGKTQIIHQYVKQQFNHNYMMTQGCEYTLKDMPIESRSYTSVELHMIDIAGQNIFKDITLDLLCKANQVMLVYDATNSESFRLLHDWHASIKQENAGKQLTGIVVANKMDLDSKLQVSSEDGHAFAMNIGFEFCEVSAMQSRNLDKPFKVLAQSFYNKFEEKIASLMDV